MSLFSGRSKIVLGVVHLAALPGAPHFAGDRSEIRQRALNDVRSYVAGGIDGIIIENYGDTPFHGGRVEPSVVAEMTRIVTEARQLIGNESLLGVNILRNDASAAIAVAAAAGADFVRVNVHTGAMLCDQGWIEGQAPQTLRFPVRSVVTLRSRLTWPSSTLSRRRASTW